MILLPISESQKEKAKEFAEGLIATGRQPNRFNQPREIQEERTMIGKLGEILFFDYMQSQGIELNEGNMLDTGIGDGLFGEYDFITPKGETVDIKTASRPFHKRIMIPMAQFEKHKKDYYVGVKLNLETDSARIYGYTTKEILEKNPVEFFGEGKCKAIELEKLMDLSFIKNLFCGKELDF